MEALKNRLMSNVEMIPIAGCWIWMGAIDKHGYGKIFTDGRPQRTHRVSFSIHNDETPNHVLHTCDVPSCVNPSHLYSGSHSDNMRDRENRNRGNKATGIKNGKCRFSSEDIKRMRDLKSGGFSLRAIARMFDISGTGYVSLVVNMKVRKYG